MELTDEQKAILETLNNDEKVIKINAVAGAGKSTLLKFLAEKIRETDKESKILYIVFNRNMLEEAKEKFAGLDVDCYTTHGFALKRFSAIKKGEIEVIPALDFNMFMEMKNSKKYAKAWVRFKTINELLEKFCLTFDDLDTFISNIYRDNNYEIHEKVSLTERDFFADLYNYMIKHGFYTHGMYLKAYACECKDKITTYKYILCDEAQDVSASFFRILKRMRYDKLYAVGDTFQNIFSFCKTVNIFKKLDGETYPLTRSFRINDMECELANKVLQYHYKDYPKNFVKNYFNRTEIEDKTKKTILFRLNATLFEYAVNLIMQADNIKVHFLTITSNGRTESFEECFNDMLYFYYRLLDSYKSEVAQEFKQTFKFSTCKLIDNYIKICKKEGLGLYHYLCRNKSVLPLEYAKYFNFFMLNEMDIINVVNKVKNSENCTNPNKEYFLSTVHTYKGLEAESVRIAPDLWSLKSDAECNLCYVAVTRATKYLDAQPIIDLLDGE